MGPRAKLEQQERLRSEIPPPPHDYPLILLKLLDKMYKYEMDPSRTVGATERTRDAGQRDGRTDGRTEWNQYTLRGE